MLLILIYQGQRKPRSARENTYPIKIFNQAIRIIQIEDDGNIIEKDAIVEGQSRYAAIYGQNANKLRKNFRVMESEINEFFKGLQNLTEDEKIKQLERQLDKILAEIENLSVQMKHKLEDGRVPDTAYKIFDFRNLELVEIFYAGYS
jgi:predicted transcriptional regulator